MLDFVRAEGLAFVALWIFPFRVMRTTDSSKKK